jgi:peptide deformylase
MLGDDRLRQKSQPVKEIGPKYKKIAADLIETLHAGEGIGLAGPQVGLMERIFVVQIGSDEPHVFINPTIIGTSQETGKYEEGCLSIPGQYADEIRPKSVKVQAWNERGRPFTIEADGLLGRAIQHEFDHLEGVLFIDKLGEAKRERLIEKYEKAQRAAAQKAKKAAKKS